jgi:hypothetical protein
MGAHSVASGSNPVLEWRVKEHKGIKETKPITANAAQANAANANLNAAQAAANAANKNPSRFHLRRSRRGHKRVARSA